MDTKRNNLAALDLRETETSEKEKFAKSSIKSQYFQDGSKWDPAKSFLWRMSKSDSHRFLFTLWSLQYNHDIDQDSSFAVFPMDIILCMLKRP